MIMSRRRRRGKSTAFRLPTHKKEWFCDLFLILFIYSPSIQTTLSAMKFINMTFLVMPMLLDYAEGEQYLRALPGAKDYFDMNMFSSPETGFAAGVAFAILFICFLICCCCGRCSLWDILALVCIWDICCDRGGIDPGFLAL